MFFVIEQLGGAIYALDAGIEIQGNSTITFEKNYALNGGALYLRDTFFQTGEVNVFIPYAISYSARIFKLYDS